MFTSFSIGNFKAFGPTQEIPIRPITLVFGPNSAGKSSIIQSLLLARHIHDTGNVDAHQTTLGGAAVDLGGFARYVHQHEGGKQTTMKFAFQRSGSHQLFHYFDNFEVLQITYTIGAQGFNESTSRIANVSIDISFDDRRLLRLVRSDSGEFCFDETDFLSRSFIATESLWSESEVLRSVTINKYLRQLRRLPHEKLPEIAEKYGLALSEIVDRATGVPSVQGAERIYNAKMSSLNFDELRPIASKDANTTKEHLIRELRGMKYKGSLLDLTNIGELVRENPDFDVFASEGEIDSPQRRGPVEFYERYLQMESYASDEPRSRKDEETRWMAWAMAVKYDVECVIEAACNSVRKELSTLAYLGPLRWIPPRLISDGEQFDASWKAGGGDAWQRLRREPELLERVNRFLQDTLHSQYRLRCQQLAPELDAEKIQLCVKRAIERSAAESDSDTARVAEDASHPVRAKTGALDLAASLESELRAQTTGEGLTELSLVDAATGLAVSHRDVGTGISQIMPVLVNAAGGKNQLIAIEQPELHLHPALQAELGDVFIESALGENQNKFLIETHSEHLLLRIMRRMRETATGKLPPGAHPLTPKDVALLYVAPGAGGSIVEDIGLNEHGELIKGWPGGFFEEGLREMFS